MKNYEVEIRPGVTTTVQYDDETAKRLGLLKGGKADSRSAASETPANTEAPAPANKELTAAEIKRQKAEAAKAAKAEAAAAKTAE